MLTQQEVKQESITQNEIWTRHIEPLLSEIRSQQVKFGEAQQEIQQNVKKAQEDVLDINTRMNRNVIQKEQRTKEENHQEYRQAYVDYLRRGYPIDREVEKRLTGDYNEGYDPQGGYLVIPDWSNRIYDEEREMTPMLSQANVITIGTNVHKIPAYTEEEFEALFVGERQARPGTDSPDFREVNIDIKEMYCEPKLTQWVLEDNVYNLENEMVMKISDMFARRRGRSCMFGTGVLDPIGVLNTDIAGARFQSVETENAAAPANMITTDDIYNLFYDIKTAYSGRGSYFMNRGIILEIMKLVDLENRPLWQPSLQDGTPARINGKPFFESPDMSADTNTPGTPIITFGDWKRAYTIAMRIGIVTRRDDLTEKGYVKLYTRTRWGANVVDYKAYSTLVIQSA